MYFSLSRTNQYVIAAMVFSLLIGLLAMYDFMMAFIIVGGGLAFYFLYNHHMMGFLMLILITPFSGHLLVNQQIGGIPGLKVYNIIAFITVIGFLAQKRRNVLSRFEWFFIISVSVMLIVSVLRSIPYLDLYNFLWNDTLNVQRYIQSHLLKPLLVFMPFALITIYVKDRKEADMILLGIVLALMALSIYLMYLYKFAPSKTQFELVRAFFSEILGFHGNDLSGFYILSFPMLMAYALHKKGIIAYGSVILVLVSLALLYSRMGYLALIFAVLSFMFVSNRKKYLPHIAVFGVVLVLLLPSSVTERAKTGFGRNSSMNNISAGRISDIWIPVVKEVSTQPIKLLIGDGRYAFTHTKAFNRGLVLEVTHAHNMYIDTILDVGLIGLFLFLYFLKGVYDRIKKAIPHINDSYHRDMMYAIQVIILTFLFSGLTDRVILPFLPNAFLWIILGVALVFAKSYINEAKELPEGDLVNGAGAGG